MKATELHFSVILFIMVHKVVLQRYFTIPAYRGTVPHDTNINIKRHINTNKVHLHLLNFALIRFALHL